MRADDERLQGRPPAGEQPGQDAASPIAGVNDSSGERAVEEDLDALLADAHRERDEYLDLAKRTKADFENFRKRMAGEVSAASLRGKSELAKELIDPVDNLERALQSVGVDADREDPLSGEPSDASREMDAFAQGVLFVFLGLRETLARHGVEAVNPLGEKFDPQWHEALSMKPSEGSEAGIVVEVMQKGYRIGDQLIRPARVVVSN
ncbi:MAG: nucleotide exchange factor GrpE [Solirubrobacterales bacterium]